MTQRISTAGVIVLLAVLAGGCATIVSGRSQEVTFESEPDGVTVTVAGRVIGKTPVTTMLKKKSGQTVTFEKDGYKTQTRQLTTTIEGWFWGNIVIGGLLGSTTDGVTGSMHEYSPSQYYVTMVPLTAGILELPGDKAELKSYIVSGYRQIQEHLSRGDGEYLESLLVMLKVDGKDRDATLEQLRGLSQESKSIPDFAERVASYYMR